MPRDDRDDNDHKGEGKRDEGRRTYNKPPRPLDDQLRASIRESRSQFIPKSSPEEEESKRRSKWLNFARSKVSLGFQHLDSAFLPKMSEERHGFAIRFEKITGWNLPASVVKAVDAMSQKPDAPNYELQVRLSLSMYHLSSNSFFGSTWMGPPLPLGSTSKLNLSKVIDFEYNDIIYMISRIIDSTCVAVIEVVLCQYDVEKSAMIAQYG